MTSEFSYQNLADKIRSVPGEPGASRSLEILNILFEEAKNIDETAPITKLLEMDKTKSTPDTGGFGRGQKMGLRLASEASFEEASSKGIHKSLVRYLLVPIAGSRKRGRSIEFSCRQFEFAVREKLRTCSCLRFAESSYIQAVAAGVFYSESRRDMRCLAAYSVSQALWNAGLTAVAHDNLDKVHNLIDAELKNDTKEFNAIMDSLKAKRSP